MTKREGTKSNYRPKSKKLLLVLLEDVELLDVELEDVLLLVVRDVEDVVMEVVVVMEVASDKRNQSL